MREDRQLPATFSEPEAQRILARAAELEATNGTQFTIEDLRQIAAKAGIEAHALEHAIHESRAVDTPRASGQPATAMKSGDIATLAISGVALGALAIVADNWQPLGNSAIPIFAPSALLVAYRALRHPVREGFSGLLRDLGVFFGAFTAVIAAEGGIEGASIAMTWSMMASGLACGILALRGARASVPVAETTPVDTQQRA
jgi:hypothetical protein